MPEILIKAISKMHLTADGPPQADCTPLKSAHPPQADCAFSAVCALPSAVICYF
jgi:hypothetical protein